MDDPTRGQGLPALPESALTGLPGRYVEIMAQETEAPLAYHLGSLLTAISAALTEVEIAGWGPYGTLPLNLFGLLVGDSGRIKTTPRRWAQQAVQRAMAGFDDGLGLRVMRGTGSAEGIIDYLIALAHEDDESTPIVPHTLFDIGEFTGYLEKAENTATKSLVKLLLAAYDGDPNYDRFLAGSQKTGKKRKRLPMLTFSMLGDTQPGPLTTAFTTKHVQEGLFNRLDIWIGERHGMVSRPGAKGTYDKHQVHEEVERPLGHLLRTAHGFPDRRLRITPDADDKWTESYAAYVYDLMDAEDAVFYRRYTDKVFKLAGIHAVLEARSEIAPRDITRGIQLADYLVETAKLVGGRIGATSKDLALAWIVDRVDQLGPVTISLLNQQLNSTKKRELEFSKYGGTRELCNLLIKDGELKADGDKVWVPDQAEDYL